jgi:hypothetical protein
VPRELKLPSERDWQRAVLLEARAGPREPELISDGGGLPFAPGALAGAPAALDPQDPAVEALLAHLTAVAAPKRASRAPWRRRTAAAVAAPSVTGWRLLARTDSEVLFALGRPPRLVTLALKRDARRGSWRYAGSSSAQPLRVTRDGIRASSWRLDPAHETQPEETVLRVLVTEQTFASGQRADGRVLAPDMYLDTDLLVLRMFVSPRPGYQSGSRNPETPVRVALPDPVGHRRLIDGALVQFYPAGGQPSPADHAHEQ